MTLSTDFAKAEMDQNLKMVQQAVKSDALYYRYTDTTIISPNFKNLMAR